MFIYKHKEKAKLFLKEKVSITKMTAQDNLNKKTTQSR